MTGSGIQYQSDKVHNKLSAIIENYKVYPAVDHRFLSRMYHQMFSRFILELVYRYMPSIALEIIRTILHVWSTLTRLIFPFMANGGQNTYFYDNTLCVS